MVDLRIIIAGSRTIIDSTILYQALINAITSGFIPPADIIEIVAGGAKGVDLLAKQYAQDVGYQYAEFLPDYKQYAGKIAPLIRNTAMAHYGDILIAVWDGQSSGTKHMISEMKKLGKPVYIYNYR